MTNVYSNGFTEGMNHKIKVLKRTAFGFRNFNRFWLRILWLSRVKQKIKKDVRKVHSHLSVTDDLKGPQHLTKSQFAYTVLRNIHQLFSHEN